MKVYVVMHDYGVPYECATTLVAVYSTNEKAVKAIEEREKLHLFDDCPINDYYIVEEELR